MIDRSGQPRCVLHITLGGHNSRRRAPSKDDPITLDIISTESLESILGMPPSVDGTDFSIKTEDTIEPTIEHTWGVTYSVRGIDVRSQNPEDTIDLCLADLPRLSLGIRFGDIVQAVDQAIDYHLESFRPHSPCLKGPPISEYCDLDRKTRSDSLEEEGVGHDGGDNDIDNDNNDDNEQYHGQYNEGYDEGYDKGYNEYGYGDRESDSIVHNTRQ